jgi:glycerate dehydrogenase
VVDRLRCDHWITNRVGLGRRELEKLPELRMIAVAVTEYDRIDVGACRERGIVVSNLRGWCYCSVSEYLFALALSLRRNLSEQVQVACDATWERSEAGSRLCTHPARDLCGDTMGISVLQHREASSRIGAERRDDRELLSDRPQPLGMHVVADSYRATPTYPNS